MISAISGIISGEFRIYTIYNPRRHHRQHGHATATTAADTPPLPLPLPWPQHRGQRGWWAVNLVGEIWRFNPAAKSPTPNPGASCFVLLGPPCSMSHALFLASATFPTAKIFTATFD